MPSAACLGVAFALLALVSVANGKHAYFDNLEYNPGGANEIGDYNGLNFQGFALYSPPSAANGTQTAGLRPESGHNVIETDSSVREAYGHANVTNSAADPKPYWPLWGLYFGCVEFQHGKITTIPTSCIMTVHGYPEGRIYKRKKVEFIADGSPLQNLTYVDLYSEFGAHSAFVFKATSSDGTPVALVTDSWQFDATA